jgi:hypothetical protein
MSRKNKLFALRLFSVIIALMLCACGRKKDSHSNVSENARPMFQQSVKEGEFVYDAQEKRDPFIPLVSSDGRILEPRLSRKTKDALYLEGIMYDPAGLSYAVINAEVARVGDPVGDYKVIKIESQKVTLLKDGKEVELKMEE